MRDDVKILDCDRHVMEPGDIWDNYLEPAYRHHNVKTPGWFTFGTHDRFRRVEPRWHRRHHAAR